jgi:long-chain acyl-CoA synthetase
MTETLLSRWNATVAAAPDATAVVDAATWREVTRAELDGRANIWRDAHGQGTAGQIVVISEPNGPEWFSVFLGLLKSGAVIAPLDPGEPRPTQLATATSIGAGWLWAGGAMQRVEGRPRIARDDRRIIKLTSGSTGTPRALGFTDAQMLADGRQVCAGMGIAPTDVNFGLIPFGHSYGLGNIVVPLLAQGTCVVCGAVALPHAIADAIERGRATVFPAVPALLRALAISDIPPDNLGSLRTIISAGAPLAPDVAAAFTARFGRKVHSFYGSTETGGITFDRSGEAARTGRSVGVPLPGVSLKFGRGRRFDVESAAVFSLGNRRRSVMGLGMHRPADLGALTADGELVLLGRAGRFVKIAGRRLNLAEVERALREIPGVRDAFVVAHSARADALEAAVATDHAADFLRSALRERMAGWKIPKRILTLPAFPLTARGKTDTRALREKLGG